jgi:hypothetical protein
MVPSFRKRHGPRASKIRCGNLRDTKGGLNRFDHAKQIGVLAANCSDLRLRFLLNGELEPARQLCPKGTADFPGYEDNGLT